MITRKYYKLVRVSYADSDVFHLSNITTQDGTLTITKQASFNNNIVLKYSLDGINYTTYDFIGNPTILVPAKGNIYMKGTIPSSGDGVSYTLSMDVDHVAIGNVISLIDETNYNSITTTSGCLIYLFYNDTHLISAADMTFGNITTAHGRMLGQVFQGCTSLTAAPVMTNITSVADFGMNDMFKGCTSLAEGPNLNNITSINLRGINNLFMGCTSLTAVYAPSITNWPPYSQLKWMDGVAASGTMYFTSQASYDAITSDSINGVPTGWTKQIIN